MSTLDGSINRSSAPTAALRLAARPQDDGRLYLDADDVWRDGTAFAFVAESDQAAAARLAARAEAVVGALPDTRGSVEVLGVGLVAALVRRMVGSSATAAPTVVIDLTGDPDALTDATRNVSDLGTLLLAGAARGRAWEIDLYPDIHVRGLTVVGLQPISQDATVRPPDGIEPPAVLSEGTVPPVGWRWGRIVALHHDGGEPGRTA